MKSINRITIVISISTLIVGILLGWLIFGRNSSQDHQYEILTTDQNQLWTCSMHPSIRQNEPGKCPICAMDLIPLESNHSDDNPLEIKMSPAAMKLANIQTKVIEIENPLKEIRLYGKVQPDEQNIYSQTSHISGRIEHLKVSITGEFVKKGQEIASIYSPELVTAQEELFEAYKIRETQPALYLASREKLKNWKLTEGQVDEIIQMGVPREHFPILADVSGVVISKEVNLGDHLKQGSLLYQIADLSRIWILFDVYESEISWVKIGDEVVYSVQSFPGKSYTGKINFIDPVINSNTRVAKARISVHNSNLKLKPEMFVSGVIKSPVSQNIASLIVPKSAVMWTGKRSVVYVKSVSDVGIAFTMREIILGPSLGDSYIIEEGLEEGEEIAIHGTFSIDAAAQLAGKPSMMSPEGGMMMTGHNHGANSSTKKDHDVHSEDTKSITFSKEAKLRLSILFDSYLSLKDVLVDDDYEKSISEAKRLKDILGDIPKSLFEGDAHQFWMQEGMPLAKIADQISNANDIIEARKPFKPFSSHMINLAKAFNPLGKQLFIQHCPMADDFKGADWLSTEENIMNPYYGASMLTCGEVKDTIQ